MIYTIAVNFIISSLIGSFIVPAVVAVVYRKSGGE